MLKRYDEKLSRPPEVIEWMERNKWEEYPPLQPGQRVRATQDIDESDYGGGKYVAFGSLGWVVSRDEDKPYLYNVKWDKKRVPWACVYDPKARYEEDGWSGTTEIAPVDEPDPTNDPRTYTKRLL